MPRSTRARLLPPDPQRTRSLSEDEQTLIAQAIRCLERQYLVKQNEHAGVPLPPPGI